MRTHKQISDYLKTFSFLLGFGAVLLAFAVPVYAGTYDVLNNGDAGADTLRQAITDLNTSAENGTIVFGSGAEGTITLGSALPTLNYETIFDLSDYEVSLSGYSGGTAADKWFKFDTTGSGTLILRGCTWSVGAGMVVGDNNNGNLTITDSSAFSTAYSSYIGSANDSNGAVLVDSNATWTSSEDIYIGSGGVGTLYISGGADVSSRSGIIAGYSGGDGTVTVTGAGSTWTNTNGLTIANAGPGGLNISDGGTVSDDWSDVGNAGVGTVNVDGAGSAWNNTGDLNIGKANDGFLTVSNGGAVTGNHIYAAKDAGSHAGIYVGDTGSTLTAGTDLTIGNSGAAEIVVYDGATVTVNSGAGTITLGKNADSEGLLVVGGGGAGLSGTVDAAEIAGGSGSAYIVFGQTDDFTFDPVISGGIEIAQKGSGTTTLSGNNTYTGSTGIQSGTIKLGNDSALGTQDEGTTVDEGASLDLNGHDLFSASEDEPLNIAGSGTGGEGALFNSTAGMSTYSGSITLTAASTIGVTDAAGSMLIYRDINTGAAGYDITFDGDGDLLLVNTMTGKITGNGNVIKNGAGEMLLYMTGDNYTGSTAINEGKFTLGGSEVIPDTSAVTIASGAELDLNGKDETIGSLAGAGNVINRSTACTLTAGSDGSSTTFSGVISDGTGATSFTKEGAGTLVLTGASTYSGNTTINNGTLRVENANAVGTGALTNDAALDIGSTSLTVNGVYSQNAGSSLAVVASSASSYGNISSASNAFVDAGSSVNVTVSGFLPKNSRLRIVDGAGGAGVGIPGTITSNNSRLRFSAVSSDGDLFLVVDRSTAGFASVSSNPNIAAVGAALDNITAPSGDMLTVLNTLELMDDSGVASDLGTLSPVVDGGILNVSNSSFSQFIGTSNARLSDLFAQAREAEETGISAGSEGFSGAEAWGRGFGEYLKQDARGFSNGYRATVWGTALGGDMPAFNNRVRLGLSGGYASTDLNSKDNSGTTDIDSYEGTLYAGYIDAEKPYYIDGSFSFAYNKYDGSRRIAVGNTTSTADADYDGQQYSVMFDGGYTIDSGKFRITPLASLQYMRLHLQSYTETGADALNLSVKAQNYDMLQSGLGMKLERPFETNDMVVVPEIHAKWLYDFIGDKQETTSTFAGGGGSFATNGFDPAQNSMNVGAKLTLASHNNWSLETNYDFEYKEDFTSHTGWADIRYRF